MVHAPLPHSAMKSQESILRTLIQSISTTLKSVGTTLSATSVLYFLHYGTTLGTKIVEFLPLLMSNTQWTRLDQLWTLFQSHFGSGGFTNVYSYLGLLMCLGLGVGLRLFGTLLQNEAWVSSLETIMYGEEAKTTSEDTHNS